MFSNLPEGKNATHLAQWKSLPLAAAFKPKQEMTPALNLELALERAFYIRTKRRAIPQDNLDVMNVHSPIRRQECLSDCTLKHNFYSKVSSMFLSFETNTSNNDDH